ncbi:DUF423 domain-containing protein [Zobellia galactanivorans]|uniref:DUF423 domain-containing protein n=1 Tax=Zobellia galactanivorans (strain DSM 12802 / CCUG 47099 / CIP 106680 / NCIMB 13871 / Dsij) TaxID=63186 RepID=UPI00030A1CDC|nr:DUF423 domain-containing protein [Zobellia galactanivorans]MBU3026490.1 DUF423 domain-containing protein [Zobellia galactanivorans]MDO6809367.1 DUF423 domain-containing protein [Zobellia galactanivorans]
MVLLAQIVGALYGLLAVVFGAFGAHALKKLLSVDQLKSFETGVKYQMYHAMVLLLIGFNFNMDVPFQEYMVYCFVIGTFLFSFSIYALVISAAKGRKLRFLGPVTPLGGLLLVCGWALLLYSFLRNLV